MRAFWTLALLLVVSGCARDETPKPNPSAATSEALAPSSSAAATQAPPSPPPLEIDDKLLSIEEDFEQEAARDISPTNLEAELNRLEKEINEPEPKAPQKGSPAPQ